MMSVCLKLVIHPKPAHSKPQSQDEVLLHPSSVPGIQIGKVIEIYHPEVEFSRLLLPVSCSTLRDDQRVDTISIVGSVVDTFHLRDRLYQKVNVIIVNPDDVALDSVEVLFKGQYLNRSDMWRLKTSLINDVVYMKKLIHFCLHAVSCQVFEMWSKGGDRVSCGVVIPDTKIVFRSLTSMFHIYIQMSEEMWDYDVYGDLYFEKAVNGFLAELFNCWKKHGANHEVTITLFSRVIYKAVSISDIPDYMRDRVSCGLDNLLYEDFYRVAVQGERRDDWNSVLGTIRHLFTGYRQSLLDFHRDRADPNVCSQPPPKAFLSSAAQGNFLEVLNISMNVFEKHCMHRSLERTGQMCVLISPGVGVYQVKRELNNLTKSRIIDYGVGIDLVCVGEQPLHAVPLLKFHNRSRSELADYYLPHTWINLSFYSSNKRLGYSDFVPRIKVPPPASKPVLTRHQTISGTSSAQDNTIPSSVYDYDAYDAQVFDVPDGNASHRLFTMSLKRHPSRKRSSTASRLPHRSCVSAMGSPVHIDSQNDREVSSRTTGNDDDQLHTATQSSTSPNSDSMLLAAAGQSNSRSESSCSKLYMSFDDSDVVHSPPRPASAVSSACDLSISRNNLPGRALFNPFDPRNIVVKHSSNRRRWSHIFPKGPKGVPFQQHHFTNPMALDLNGDCPLNPASNTQTGASPSLAFLWGASSNSEQEWSANVITGVDWKSLTMPACLPITTDYIPESQILNKDHLVVQYPIVIDDTDNSDILNQLSLQQVFEEIVSQRLCQGFQLLVCSSSLETIGGRSSRQGNLSLPPAQGSDEPRPSYLLSIGRVFHYIALQGSTIYVTHYRPPQPRRVLPHTYRYWARSSYHASFHPCQVVFNTDSPEDYSWNRLDNYVCSRGGSDFPLTNNLKFWRCRFILIASKCTKDGGTATVDYNTVVEEFIRFISATTFAQNKFKRAQAGLYSMRERGASSNNAERMRARSGSCVVKTRHDSTRSVQSAASSASHSNEDVSLKAAGGETDCLLGEDSSTSEISAALRSADTGLSFLTRTVQCGLPEYTFISSELVQWVMAHVSGVQSEHDAVQYCQKLRRQHLVVHASGDRDQKFINGFYLFHLADPGAGPALNSEGVHSQQFRMDWIEVETQLNWPGLLGCGNFLAEALPDEDDASAEVQRLRECLLNLDVAGHSERPEWGQLVYESSFRPDRAYQLSVHWLVGSGGILSDLVVGWQRRADNCGLRLVQVPALICGGTEDGLNADPLRIAVHVPLNLQPLRQCGRPLFAGLPTSSWRRRLQLLQSAVLDRLQLVRLRSPQSGSPLQFVHVSGQCFVQVPEAEWSAESGDVRCAEFLWYHNHLLSRRGRLPRSSVHNCATKLLHDLTNFCDDVDGRLTALWHERSHSHDSGSVTVVRDDTVPSTDLLSSVTNDSDVSATQ